MALSVTSPIWQQVNTPALDMRRFLSFDRYGESVRGMAVVQRGAGANYSVDIAAGEATVQGDLVTNQGLYYVYNDATVNLTGFAAANATNPRIDRITLKVDDAFHGGAGNTASFPIITGTATAGATLTNLTGAGAVPASSILLANVLIPATATTITTANIDTTVRYTTFPANPMHGQEYVYLADATNGVQWRFKYNADSASSFKWEFVGGAPLFSTVATGEATASGTPVDLATTGPQITIPRAGDYDITFGFRVSESGAGGGNAEARVFVNGTTDTGVVAQEQVTNIVGATFTVSRTWIPSTRAASDTVRLKYSISNTISVTFADRWLVARPIRVS
jgi:hypothetical protein